MGKGAEVLLVTTPWHPFLALPSAQAEQAPSGQRQALTKAGVSFALSC
jgi:hypothetical protein